MRRSSPRRAAGSRLRGLGVAFVLGIFAASVTVGVALACTDRGDAACGPIRFQAAPRSLNVGIQIGSTCLEPGTTDYSVTLTGPGGFSQVIAQGSVSPPSPIVPQSVFAVPTAGQYRLVYTTTTNRGETQDCVTGTTELMVDVPSGPQPTEKPTAKPTPSPTETPAPTATDRITPAPTDEPIPTDEVVTEAPTEEVASEAPSEVPAESASEVPAGSGEPSASESPSPGGSGGAGSGGGAGGGPDFLTVGLVGLILIGGVGAAAAAFLYIRSGQAAGAPWKAGPWKCARCNAINREGTDHCRRCYARWDGTS